MGIFYLSLVIVSLALILVSAVVNLENKSIVSGDYDV